MSVPDYAIREALFLTDDTLKAEGNVFYAPVYMAMFVRNTPLPDRMIYKID